MRTVADRRECFFVQDSLIAAVAVLVTFRLLLVWFLNPPYQNSNGSIKPHKMERLLPIVEVEQVTPPCDAGGKPVRLRTRPAG